MNFLRRLPIISISTFLLGDASLLQYSSTACGSFYSYSMSFSSYSLPPSPFPLLKHPILLYFNPNDPPERFFPSRSCQTSVRCPPKQPAHSLPIKTILLALQSSNNSYRYSTFFSSKLYYQHYRALITHTVVFFKPKPFQHYYLQVHQNNSNINILV